MSRTIVVVIRKTDTIIVGGGQAGLSLSYFMTRLGLRHAVLERDRVGEQWRGRWDSLHLLTPNWLNRLHGARPHANVEGFLPARDFSAYLRRYAGSFGAPLYERTGVRGIRHKKGVFEVETERGGWRANNLVLATGYAAVPRLPAVSASAPRGLTQLHSSEYRSPAALPPGGILVVGAGPSGQQIAAELRRAGRDVVLAVGSHTRSLRRYRGRDIWHWLYAIGDLHRTIDEVDRGLVRRTPSLAVSGANGGEQLDLHVLAELGVRVTGRLTGFDGTTVSFADDLDESIVDAELGMRATLDAIDEHIADVHPEWPHAVEPAAEVLIQSPPTAVDLAARPIGTVLWATGYGRDYGWLDVPHAVDRSGEILQRYGVSPVQGLYTIGLNFQRYRASHFIGGVGADALMLARELATTRRSRVRLQPRGVPLGFALAGA